MNSYDLENGSLRELNVKLQSESRGLLEQSGDVESEWRIINPKGSHALAVGLDGPLTVLIDGSTGYYCGGMNKEARIEVKGSVGPGVGENMMSGRIDVHGDASQYAGATGRGGLLAIRGNASSRCGISMKGVNIVVGGNVGHMSAFMGQRGNLVVLGDAGDAFGDSIYEARLFVRGKVKSLGVDCVEKEMRDEHVKMLESLLADAGMADIKSCDFRRYGSSRKSYNFGVDDAGSY